MLRKPDDMFDRDREWSALTRFATDDQPGATLGVVSGRRRQGKTYLLEALCRELGGFYFGATEAVGAESLRRIGATLADFLRTPIPFRPSDWYEVADALLALGRERPVPVVIDEFPYLARANPAYTCSNSNPIPPCRTRSRSSMLSASVSIPATIVATFPAAFDPSGPGRRTFSASCRPSLAASASRITGSNPASEIKFSSSKTASTAPAVCNKRIS